MSVSATITISYSTPPEADGRLSDPSHRRGAHNGTYVRLITASGTAHNAGYGLEVRGVHVLLLVIPTSYRARLGTLASRRWLWFKKASREQEQRRTRKVAQMPTFMDVHTIDEGVSAEDVAGAHQADVATQGAYGVDYRRYWVDEEAGKIFCLVDAPDADTAMRVHREAHGLVADEIYEVSEGS